jgi:hypothetical protein
MGPALLRAAALSALASPVAAHDHWIAPSSFAPGAGERVDVHLRVGHPAQFEEQPRDPRRFVRFELVGAEGARHLLGLDGRSPAAFFRTDGAGPLTLVYQSDHAFVEIAPETYARYLAEEGLDDVAAERERRCESARPGRDSYLRCDKALLRVGGGAAGPDRSLGLPIELVLESDPLARGAGGELVLRLEFEGRPLAGRQVKLMRLEAPHTIALARTDEHGRVRFAPDSAGAHVASAVHQRRAETERGLEGDWEGFWASLAFEVGER